MGSRPLGHYALSLLQSISQVEVIASVVKEPIQCMVEGRSFYIANNIQNDHNLSDMCFDIGVSINYWKIIPSSLLKIPRLGFVNLHHSYNLSLRGRNMSSLNLCR